MEKRCRDYPSMQSKPNRNSKNEEEIINFLKKSLHALRNFWKPHKITSSCWYFFCVNDNQNVDIEHA
jgi:hypothetical protein